MLALRPSTKPCLTRETGKPSLLSSSTSTCSTRQTVQPSSQCKSHDAGATNLAERGLWRSTQTIHEPTALNTADPRDVWCSKTDADGWCGTKLTSMERYHLQLSRLQRGRNPLQGATAMDDYISPSGESGLADRASSQASKWAPRCSRCSTAAPKHVICLHWLFRSAQHRETHHGQESCQALLFKQPQERLWKWGDQLSRFWTWRQEKQQPIFGVRWQGGDIRILQRNTVKPCPHVRLFINYVLYQECNNYLKVCQECNNHALCQEYNNYQQQKILCQECKFYLKSSTTSTQALPQV